LQSASATGRDTLSDLTGEALSAIQSFSAEIGRLRARANESMTELESNRLKVQHEREEREILHSLELGSTDIGDAPESSVLLSLEKQYQEQLGAVSAFERGLADFASVLVTAVRQLEAGTHLPDANHAAQLSTRMAELRAREDERRRFARDVHDGPAQAFANAIIGLEFIERALHSDRDTVLDDALGEIERIKTTMREGLTEIRRFIFDNRPTMLQDRGLAATVRHYVQSYQSIFPMVVRLDIDDDISRLDAERELTAFRVVQESIQNASKHARASRVDVSIRRGEEDHIVVTVSDDGRGFDPERVSAHAMGGAGLKGMEERASLVGGTLLVQSERGEGTKIQLIIAPPDVS
jgi:two-component system sensor histidine kinase DegS